MCLCVFVCVCAYRHHNISTFKCAVVVYEHVLNAHAEHRPWAPTVFKRTQTSILEQPFVLQAKMGDRVQVRAPPCISVFFKRGTVIFILLSCLLCFYCFNYLLLIFYELGKWGICMCACVLVLCECCGRHFTVANGYIITGHGHYRGYSRAMWPHIITIDAQFAVCGCWCHCCAPTSLLKARSSLSLFSK